MLPLIMRKTDHNIFPASLQQCVYNSVSTCNKSSLCLLKIHIFRLREKSRNLAVAPQPASLKVENAPNTEQHVCSAFQIKR